MKVTFIIRDITESAIAETMALPAREAHDKLTRWAFGDLRHCVSVKYGSSNAFRDRVEWNGLLKSGAALECKLEPRRGYNLATFTAN